MLDHEDIDFKFGNRDDSTDSFRARVEKRFGFK